MFSKNIEISNDEALRFLKENRAGREQISISPADRWIGAEVDGQLVGVVGITETRKTARIKGFFVRADYRRQGIGDAILKEALESIKKRSITAFATVRSEGIFRKNGFLPESFNKHEITFMRR